MKPMSDRRYGTLSKLLKSDVASSFVVFLVALPLCMGVAIASGAPVAAGLVTGIVGGLVVGLFSGSPLQISGPAAGLTVIVYQCLQERGIEVLGVVVLLAGLLQVLAGLFRLGQWFRAVSPAVVHGMLAGIGILIVAGQFHVMVDDRPKQDGVANLLTFTEAISKVATPDAAELDPALDRAGRTQLLNATGMLHLKQAELAEEVHHVLTEVDGGDAGPSAASPGATADPHRPHAVAESLRQLTGRQAHLLNSLRSLDLSHDRDEWQAAQRACLEALADLENGSVQSARSSQDRAASMLADLRDSVKSHRWAAIVGLITIALLVLWGMVVPRQLNFVPAPLVAVILATTLSVGFNLPVLAVEVPDNLLEEVYLPSLAELRAGLNPGVFLLAVQVAVIASAETLLCATAVDQLHQGPRTKYDRELAAQGIGNIVCGLLCALPATGVIVRSSANVNAGAKTRLSAVLHGIWLLLFATFLSFALRMIPTASLAAVLVYTGCKLVDLKAIRSLWNYGKSEALICVATMVAVVVTDLLTGVLIGLGLSVVKLLYAFSRLRISLHCDPATGRTTLLLAGAATFLRLPLLARTLEGVPSGTELHVNLDRLDFLDHACLDLLMNWEKQHAATGGRLIVDWDSLTARFQSVRVHEAALTAVAETTRDSSETKHAR